MRERLKNIIATRLFIDMNENGMQISEDTLATIELDMFDGVSRGSL